MKTVIAILSIISVITTGCSDKNNIYYYELTVKNAGDKEIRGVTVKTGTETSRFGSLGSGAPDKGKTAAGCAISFDGTTIIAWKDDTGKEHAYDLKLKDYLAKRKQIKGFVFTYQSDDEWKIETKQNSEQDSPSPSGAD